MPTDTALTALTAALPRRSLALFIGADLPREVTGLSSRADLARRCSLADPDFRFLIRPSGREPLCAQGQPEAVSVVRGTIERMK